MCRRLTQLIFVSTCFFTLSNTGYTQEFVRNTELGHIKKGVLQFNNPRGTAINQTTGRIYVADAAHHRIVIQNLSDGALISSFGTIGFSAGQFNTPTDVTIAADGSVYVLDASNARVQKFTADGVFQLQWGSSTSTGETGKFNNARGIAVNVASGDVYVTDQHRVQRFNSSGVFQNAVGTFGSGASQFSTPWGITVDGSGNVYVVDTGNNRIQKFTSVLAAGTPASWGTSGSGDGQFNSPNGICISSANQIFITDGNNSRVQIFSTLGAFANKFGSFGSADGQFVQLSDVAVDASGNIFVTSEPGADKLQKFNSTFVYQASYGKSTDAGLFNEPRDVAFDSNGNLFVVDQENHRIQKYNSNGVFVSQWGTQGAGDGQFSSPTGIGIDGGNNVFVVESSPNHRVQKFDNNGVFQLKFGSSGSGNGQFNGASDVAIDAANNIYVVESSPNHRVQKFSSTGVYTSQWGSFGSTGNGVFSSPRGIAVDNNGNILVVDTNNARVQKFNNTGTHILTFGSGGSANGSLSSPIGISIDADNNIYIAEQSNNRFQKFTNTGTFIAKHGISGTDAGQFLFPRGIAVSGTKIVVSDGFGRVQFFYQTAAEPAAQSDALTFSDVTGSSFSATIAAAAGNPLGYLVLRKTGSAPTGLPADTESYVPGTSIGDGRVVYNGPAGAFVQSGLASATTYHYKIFAYNGADSLVNYRLGFPLEGNQLTVNSPLSILKDINETYSEQGSGPSNLTDLGGTLLFFADNGTQGTELWKSDGAGNTLLVKDINPGSISGAVIRFGVLNSTMIFVANDGTNGTELWKTDGTEAGTTMIKDIYPGAGSGFTISAAVLMNGLYYFVANDPAHGSELWRTDGTGGGTIMVKDIEPGTESGFVSNTFAGVVMNNTLYFYAHTLATGWELWKSNGTESGTMLVEDINPGATGSGNSGNLLVASSTLVFFTADNGTNGIEYWKSDGTAAGTEMIRDLLNPGNGATVQMKVFNEKLYFFTSSIASPSTPARFWESDGTDAGTIVVKENITFVGNPASGFVEMNGTLYFFATAGSTGIELYKSDGTLAGTVNVKDIVPGAATGVLTNFIFTYNNVLYFASASSVPGTGSELWRSDGTNGGTYLISDIYPGTLSSSPTNFAASNGLVFFNALTAQGRELFKTDGTTATLVKNINAQSGTGDSYTSNKPLALNNELIFVASNGTSVQLWKSNGTEAGTMVIDPGITFSGIVLLRKVGSQIYFVANDATAGGELWKTDGTNAGTVRIKDINPGTGTSVSNTSHSSHAEINGILFFSANNGTNGTELWKTDGTDAGTVMVKDIFSGAGQSAFPLLLANVNGLLYFLATDGAGYQVWKSDGTGINTIAVTSMSGGLGSTFSTSSNHHAVVNGIYYFVASESILGSSLWKSNGTAAGTERLVSMNTIFNLVPLTNKLLFTKTSGSQLWSSDGTVAGTTKIASFGVIGGPVFGDLYTVINNTFYFTASVPSSGIELWKSDGTAAGTVLLKDFLPGPGNGANIAPYPAGDKFYLAAAEQAGHINMWESDGTACGTYKLTADIISNSVPVAVRAGQKLFFVNSIASSGSEMYTYDLTQFTAPQPTQITTHPAKTLKRTGVNFTLAVVATGNSLTYQWKKNDVNITGATESSYTKTAAQIEDSGEYKVVVSGICGTITSNAARVDVINPVKTNLTMPFNTFGPDQSYYRIVSVPLQLTNPTVKDVFEDDLYPYDNTNWRLFRYEGTTTTELGANSNISIGKGYWLIVLSTAEIDTGPGEISLEDPHVITLSQGWNQIGNPFATDVAWSDVVAANPGAPLTLKVWEGGWSNGTTLKAFGGGFVNVSQTTQLNIPRGSFIGGRQHGDKPKQPLDNDDWDVVLNVRHGNTYNNIGGVGMSSDAEETAPDGLDEYNLPRFIDFIEVVHPFSHQGYAAAKSIVPSRSENIWNFNIVTSQEDKTAEINWDNTYFGENDRNLYLVDMENDIVIDMRETAVYNFAVRSHQHRFKIIYGKEDFVRENSMPERESLQIHPNPFAKDVSVQYSVPRVSHVEIDVLNNQANVVRPLVSGTKDAGHYTIQLSGEAWAAGMYIVRMNVGGKLFYSKIIKQ